MKINYITIYLFTIIPAALLFFSNIENSNEFAISLLFFGMAATFIEWKNDDYRIKDFINKFF